MKLDVSSGLGLVIVGLEVKRVRAEATLERTRRVCKALVGPLARRGILKRNTFGSLVGRCAGLTFVMSATEISTGCGGGRVEAFYRSVVEVFERHGSRRGSARCGRALRGIDACPQLVGCLDSRREVKFIVRLGITARIAACTRSARITQLTRTVVGTVVERQQRLLMKGLNVGDG